MSSPDPIRPKWPDERRNLLPEDSAYAPPSADGVRGGDGGSYLFAVLAAGAHTLLLIGACLGTMLAGARCEKVARDFNMKLDDLTEFAVGVAHWLNNYWYVLMIVLVPCLVMDGLLLYLLHRSRRGRGWAYVLAFGVVLLIVLSAGCLGGAFFSTLDQLLEALSR